MKRRPRVQDHGLLAAVAGLVAAAVIVCSVVWIGSSAGAQPGPLLVQPAVPMSAASTSTTSPATSAPVTSSPRVGHTTSPALPVPSKSRATTEPAPPSRTSPSAKAALSATYQVRSSWDTGFIGAVQVRNDSATRQNWTVALRYDAADGVRITQAWNGSLSRQGDVTIFSGGPLEPGATQNLGFEATKQATGEVRPMSCTANGSRCRMS
jgi:cellulase/cellobiase CelA1